MIHAIDPKTGKIISSFPYHELDIYCRQATIGIMIAVVIGSFLSNITYAIIARFI